METVRSSETSVNLYHATRRHVPEVSTLHIKDILDGNACCLFLQNTLSSSRLSDKRANVDFNMFLAVLHARCS
jgi:hypothetical protein